MIDESKHCGTCKYFGAQTFPNHKSEMFHFCENESSIFKVCLASATGCEKHKEAKKKDDSSRA